ncbi:Vacuolar protein sorting-associated protein 13 [Smittium culicis]|uniref:Vacuolar protein sorting-associated protein 13 n=1 Tax=Smittium culicis TaxID=133412 RepID=A0A1R1YSS5_9FUNG|nr:Vacuolar protein sorting-associated protein 13 [Smittium culicis]
MLEGVIAKVLNGFLGGYVDNLETNQLNIGIWKGDVTLRNLSLRKDALDSLNLPLDIIRGNIGTLSLTIPWSNLKGKPVIVSIEDVTMITVEQIQEGIQRELAQKMKQLEELDYQLNSFVGDNNDKTDNSYYGQLVNKIIDNLQITIKNIHLKYEDTDSNLDRPFSIGAVLSSLSIVSTDENWTPMFVQNSSSITYKKLDLENFFFYLDNSLPSSSFSINQIEGRDFQPVLHKTILNPVAGSGKLMINKSAENGKGKTDLSLEFDQFSISLDELQYHDFLLLITNLDIIQRKKKYVKFLPNPLVKVSENPRAWLSFALNSVLSESAENGKGKTDLSLEFDQFSISLDELQYHDFLLLITNLDIIQRKKKYVKFLPNPLVKVSENPRAWLSFALNSVLSEVRESRIKWSWENIKKKCQMRRDYVELYTISKTTNIMSPEEKEDLAKLEHDLTFEELKLFRSIALPEIKKYKLKEIKANKKMAIEAESKKNNGSWLGGWVNWAAGVDPNSSSFNNAIITDTDISDLYEALDLELDEDMDVGLIKDGTKISATMTLGKCFLELKKYSSSELDTLMSIIGSNVKADLFQLLNNTNLNLSIQDFFVNDGTVENSAFPKMVKIRESSKTETDSSLPFLNISFEQNPLDNHADTVVLIKAQPLDIVFNPFAILEVQRFFKPPSSSVNSIKYLVEAASRSFSGLQNQTRSGLQYAFETHKRLDLQVDFQAPLVIVPMDICDINCGVCVLDLGHLTVLSEMVSAEALKSVDMNSGKILSPEQMIDFENLLYDWLNVKLEKLQLIVGPDLKSCLGDILTQKTIKNQHVVDRIELDFKLGLCILGERPIHLPQIIINGHLPSLQVFFSEYKYKRIMETVDILLKAISTDDPYLMEIVDGIKTNMQLSTEALQDFGIERPKDDTDNKYNDPDPMIDDTFLNSKPLLTSMNKLYKPSTPDFGTSGVIGTSMLSSFNKNLNKNPSLNITNTKNKTTNISSSISSDNSSSISSDSSSSDDSDSDQFFDTIEGSKDIVTSIKSHKSLSTDIVPIEPKKPKEINYEQENIKIRFAVDKLMVEIYEHQQGLESDDLLLCNVEVSKFVIDILNRELDMNVGIIIHEIKIEDHITVLQNSVNSKDLSQNYILYSDSVNYLGQKRESYDKNLVTVSYKRLQAGHPLFLSEIKPSGQTVDITISSIHFTIIRKSILKLYNFILNTFNSGANNPTPSPHNSNQLNSREQNINGVSEAKNSEKHEAGNNTDLHAFENPSNADSVITDEEILSFLETISVNISLDGVDMDLCDDFGNSISLAALTQGTLSVKVSKEIDLEAKIGGFSLIDNSNLPPLSFENPDSSSFSLENRKIMYITGEELLGLEYRTYDRNSSQYPGHDAFLNLNVGEMYFVFVQKTIKKLMDFGAKFAAMHELFENARQNVAESATQLTETVVQGNYKTKINIFMSAPVLSFLNSGQMPKVLSGDKFIDTDMVIAKLGQLSITNSFENVMESNKLSAETNLFNISLNNISILSRFYYLSSQTKQFIEQKLNILEDVNFMSEIRIVIGDRNGQGIIPDTKINTSINKLSVKLTNQQFKFLIDMIQIVSDTFSSTDIPSTEELSFDPNLFISDSILNSPQIHSLKNQKFNLENSPLKVNNIKSANASKSNNFENSPKLAQPSKTLIKPPVLDFSLSLPTIMLELYDSDISVPLNLAKSTFAKLDLSGIDLKYRLKASGSSIAEMCLGKVRAFDTRLSSKSCFKQFVGPRDDVSFNGIDISKLKNNSLPESSSVSVSESSDILDFPQLVIHIDMSPDDPSVVRATLDNPRIIVALDHGFQLLNFFQAPFFNSSNSNIETHPLTTNPGPTKEPNLQPVNDPALVLKANIVSPEIILLADPKSISSEALIISVRELCFSMDTNYGATIDDLRMVLCRMDQIQKTSRIIMDPLSIVGQVNVNRIRPDLNSGISSSEIINATFEVGELILKVGLHDIDLIHNVVNEFNALMAKAELAQTSSSTSSNALQVDPKTKSSNTDKNAHRNNNDSLDCAYNQSTQTASVNKSSFSNNNIMSQLISEKAIMTVNGIRVIIIHDRFDMSLLDISLSKFTVVASDWSSQLDVSTGMKLNVSTFDFHNSHWEPVIETWPFIVNIRKEIPDLERVLSDECSDVRPTQITTVSIGSKSRIEINANHLGIEVLADLFMNSKNDISLDSIKSSLVNISNDIELSQNISKALSDANGKQPNLSEPGTSTKDIGDISDSPNNIKLTAGLNFDFKNSDASNNPAASQINLNQQSNSSPANLAPSAGFEANKTNAPPFDNSSSPRNCSERIFSRGEKHPYLITNLTGLNCHIWVDLPEGATLRKKDDLVPVLLLNGSSTPWSFENWRSQKNSLETYSNQLGVQFSNGMWEWVRRISVDHEGVTNFKLSPDVDGITYLLAVEVLLDTNQFLKIVTLRSTLVVENKTMLPIELCMCNYRGEELSEIMVVKPDQKLPLPLLLSHQNAFKIRPESAFGYGWSKRNVYWRDFLGTNPQRIATCLPLQSSNRLLTNFNFHFTANFDKKSTSLFKHPLMSLIISSPLEIENLLPYNIQFRIFDKSDNCDWSNVLSSGEISSVHSVRPENLVLLSMNIPEAKYIKSDGAVINSHDTDEYPLDSEIVMYDQSGLRLTLKITRSQITYTNGACFRISIISPYILINRTNSSLFFKSKSFLRVSSDISGQQSVEEQNEIFKQIKASEIRRNEELRSKTISKFLSKRIIASSTDNESLHSTEHLDLSSIDSDDDGEDDSYIRIGNNIRPLMFSYGGFDVRNRVIIQSGLSEWSKPISLDNVGHTGEVVLLSKSKPTSNDTGMFLGSQSNHTAQNTESTGNSYVHLGIQITPGAGKFGNSIFVLLSPRYIVKNSSGLPLLVREVGVSNSLPLDPGKRIPLQYLSKEFNTQLTVSIDVESVYSMLESIGETIRNKQITAVSGGRAWSSPFLINQVGKIYIRLPKPQALASYEALLHDETENGSSINDIGQLISVPIELTTVLFSIEIIIEDSVLFVNIKRETGEWPFRIDNFTGLEISFLQDLPELNDNFTSSGHQNYNNGQLLYNNSNSMTRKSSTPFLGITRSSPSSTKKLPDYGIDNTNSLRWYTVVGYHSMPYAWDYPAIDPKFIILKVCGSYRKVSLFEIGIRPPLMVSASFDGSDGRINKPFYLYIEIAAQGNQQVLRITSNLQSSNTPINGTPNISRPISIKSVTPVIINGTRGSSESNGSSVFEPSDPVALSLNNNSPNPLKTKSTSQSIYEDISENDIVSFNFSLKLEAGIGISLISKEVVEIMYASFSGVELKVQISQKSQAVSLDIKWIQIDNQLYGALYPIVLYPTVLSGNNSNASRTQSSFSNNQSMMSSDHIQYDSKPVFQAAVVWVNDSFSAKYSNNYNLNTSENSTAIQHIKFASVLLQELSIELDEDFLLALVDFSTFDFSAYEDKGALNSKAFPTSNELARTYTSNSYRDNRSKPNQSKNKIALPNTIFDPKIFEDSKSAEKNINEIFLEISKTFKFAGLLPDTYSRTDESTGFYFDLLMLQPMKLNISFLRTGNTTKYTNAASTSKSGAGEYYMNPIEYAVNVFTMAVGNVNEVPIYLNALILENMRVSMEGLSDRLNQFYIHEFMSQLLKFVGSADVLGNPVGLFNNISSGVVDIFYEPYQGIMMSDRPQDIGIGLAKGTASFFKKTVYGFSDSFSRFTDSVGKGLSAATMDSEYQNKRRLDRFRNRPRHALLGVATGAESFAKSLTSGLAGVVLQPLEGAEKDGVGGFFKGIGKGLVGVVTKPVIGIFDMASNVTEGIRNTTAVFGLNELDRVRLPRFINKQQIIEPYSNKNALGFSWMREIGEGKFAYDDYLAHLELANSDLVTLLSYQHILMFKRNKTSKTVIGTKSNMTSEASLSKATIEWEVEIRKLQLVVMEVSGISCKLQDDPNMANEDNSSFGKKNLSRTSLQNYPNSSNNQQINQTTPRQSSSSSSRHNSISNSSGIFIPIADEVDKRWFFGKIKEAVKALGYNI